MASQRTSAPVNSGVAVQPNSRAIVPALCQRKFITSQAIQKQVTFDLFKSGLSNEYLKKLILKVKGVIKTGSATAGTTTGNLNPYDLLSVCTFKLSPTPGSGLIPINQVSGRGLYLAKAINDRNFAAQNTRLTTSDGNPGTPEAISVAILDKGGNLEYEWQYDLIFQRNHVRKSVEYGIPLSKFTSAVINLQFDLDQTLFVTGSSNVWDFSGLTVELWGDWDYDTAPNGVHAVELYEQSFPIPTNGQFLINQLPAGVIYTDFFFSLEDGGDNTHLGLPTDQLIDNIDIEGGGRNWTFAGEENISFFKELTRTQFDGSVWSGAGIQVAADNFVSGYGDAGFNTTGNGAQMTANSGKSGLAGLYGFPLRGGSFYRGFDARNTQLLIKLNVTGLQTAPINARLLAWKMNPYGVVPRNPDRGGSTSVKGKQ